MYPEESGGADASAAPAAPMPARIGRNLEGFIPLILILIIGLLLAVKFDVITTSTPVVGQLAGVIGGGYEAKQMLIIGESSNEVLTVLGQNEDLVRYHTRAAEFLERNPREILANYDVVMLDQSQQNDKAISRK
ncbi:MAG: hypothetical protein HY917_01325, partial [Candidatus Diapherotrites archaeon]|nr:hypothetical protein [Candidatus Diapherotrites archaeon]